MLKQFKVTGILPARDLERARAFYRDKLGLEVDAEVPGYALFYHFADGTRIGVSPTEGPGSTGSFTQLSVAVDDIEKVVGELRSRGLEFEEYDTPGTKTVNGIAERGPNGSLGRAAYFKDSEGNLVSLIQLRREI